MKFYTSVNKRGNNILVRGYNNGKRFQIKVNYKPYLFLKTKDSESAVYRTIHDVPVKKKKFESIKDARTFIERYKETEGIDIYGYTKFEYPFIYDTFIGPNGTGEVEFDASLIKVANIDIEVGFNLDDEGNPSGGFPDPAKAENPVTAITLSLDGIRYVFGEGDFVPHQDNIRYFKCSNERSLLDSFLEIFSQLDPDVLTGWNIEGFDIPYLINRINELLGENQANRLSPWGLMEEKQIELRGKLTTFYYPMGVAVLDYMNLYKKFSYKNQESYKLDHIGFIELKMNKLDYSEYGTLYDLYLKNYQLFIEYNIHDADIVDALENKMKFIQQVFSMAYSAGVNYGDALASVRPWEVICHNFLMGRRRVVPIKSPNHHKDEYEGGYVKEPQLGKHKWVISFDLNSLYPSIIRQCNISPECLKGKLDLGMTIKDLIKGDLGAYKDMMLDNDVAMAANGTFYSRAKQGFMPELIEKMYGERVHFKNLMIEAKKEAKHNDSKELQNKITQYNNQQMVRKIFLNSLYGALANRYFMFYDVSMAEGITITGQFVIQWIAEYMNKYLNDLFKTSDNDYVLASDTDSLYITLDPLVNQVMPDETDHKKITKFLEKACEGPISSFIDKTYRELAKYMNAREHVMQMKLECIADRGIWRGKKMYVLNVLYQEGVFYDDPVIKVTGLESVRSSTPQVCRDKIKEALKIILTQDEEILHSFILDFRKEFMGLDWEQVAFPRGMSDIGKWEDASLGYKSGTPIHVKGAIAYNNLIKKHRLETKYPFIYDGDKVKFAYLKKYNPYNIPVISTPGEMPKEFGLEAFIDRDLQFEKTFIGPIESITNVVGWSTEKRATLDSFFG